MKTATKTAISIPNRVFETAEQLAKRLGMSRSELYSKALVAYLEEHRQEGVTDVLNAIYAKETAALDPAVQHLQFASLPEDEW